MSILCYEALWIVLNDGFGLLRVNFQEHWLWRKTRNSQLWDMSNFAIGLLGMIFEYPFIGFFKGKKNPVMD